VMNVTRCTGGGGRVDGDTTSNIDVIKFFPSSVQLRCNKLACLRLV
jgi:hypothetical protein